MKSDKPNVVFVMTDQQRADSFGPGRHSCANFPTMERLAGESAVFTNFFTSAIACVPSRHSFLTGRQPWALGCSGNSKYSTGNETSWMSVLRDQGYHSVSVGKTHMVHAGSFHIQTPLGKSFGNLGVWDSFHTESYTGPEDQFFDFLATKQACSAIEKMKNSGPFALFLGLHAPHAPFSMPTKYLDFCKPTDADLPHSCNAQAHEGKSQIFLDRAQLIRNHFGEITDQEIKTGIAAYHCFLKMVDDCLEQVLETLAKNGLLENTILVFCSDHGDLLGEHRLFGKAASFHDAETRIPMMIRFPHGLHKGKRLSGFASSIDFVPTLFEFLGLDPDLPLPGRSLMPMIKGNKRVREQVTCAANHGMMIRTETHKLWCSFNRDGEMYDMQKDPLEMENLYHKEEFTLLRSALTEKLLHARMEDDFLNNRPSKRESRIRMEIASSGEPEF